ncbi:MAG: hypothetical protein ACE5ID_11615, partial [Acidobacteriota bacterium]
MRQKGRSTAVARERVAKTRLLGKGGMPGASGQSSVPAFFGSARRWGRFCLGLLLLVLTAGSAAAQE